VEKFDKFLPLLPAPQIFFDDDETALPIAGGLNFFETLMTKTCSPCGRLQANQQLFRKAKMLFTIARLIINVILAIVYGIFLTLFASKSQMAQIKQQNATRRYAQTSSPTVSDVAAKPQSAPGAVLPNELPDPWAEPTVFKPRKKPCFSWVGRIHDTEQHLLPPASEIKPKTSEKKCQKSKSQKAVQPAKKAKSMTSISSTSQLPSAAQLQKLKIDELKQLCATRNLSGFENARRKAPLIALLTT
jgi:hypothetical protein